MSAGNHAQGVAYHAGRLAIPATIVMPLTTPFNKIKHTRDFGAEVILEGRDLTEANDAARALAAARGLTFIHPYDDARVIAGQGTAGLEMLEDVPELDSAGGAGGRRRTDLRRRRRGKSDKAGDRNLWRPDRALSGDGAGAPRCGAVSRAPPAQTIAEGIAVKQPGAAHHGHRHGRWWRTSFWCARRRSNTPWR